MKAGFGATQRAWPKAQGLVSGALQGLRPRWALRRDLLPELGDSGVPNAPEALPHPTQPHLHGQAGAQVHNEDGHRLPPVVDGEDEVLPLLVLIQDSQQCCGCAGQGRG